MSNSIMSNSTIRRPVGSLPPINRELYQRVTEPTSRKLTHSFTLPPRSGYAWKVPAGSVFRLTTPEGPQQGDLNIWSLQNPRERFWAARTRQLQGSHVSRGNRLWSCLPYLRPMCTVVDDSLAGYVDPRGGRCHDLLGASCDPYARMLLHGESFDYHCHSNLTRAIIPFGLTEFDVHDSLNVFRPARINQNGSYPVEISPAVSGSFIEFFAEIDLLCALSTCTKGDMSALDQSEEQVAATCKPIRIDVYKSDEAVLQGWKGPTCPGYKGMHGIWIPQGERLL
ncbi:hypothetical protein EJ06DRAFT_500868 [Trichodelitschia bisporula]|uniref:DUF1989 domain-containing protein n=1 Tax=Trichodelitschia bisporula TaxID=703511 RepID=A0A6G1HJC1_9PEZI|nr:hypothetical protein EJ06DRAFT_500868 [Trichodelitschia bisporula]